MPKVKLGMRRQVTLPKAFVYGGKIDGCQG